MPEVAKRKGPVTIGTHRAKPKRKGPVVIGSHREKKADSETNVEQENQATEASSLEEQSSPAQNTWTSGVASKDGEKSGIKIGQHRSTWVSGKFSGEAPRSRIRIGQSIVKQYHDIGKVADDIKARKITHTQEVGKELDAQKDLFELVSNTYETELAKATSNKVYTEEKKQNIEDAKEASKNKLDKAEKKRTKTVGEREEVETLSQTAEMSTLFKTLNRIKTAWKVATPTKTSDKEEENDSTQQEDSNTGWKSATPTKDPEPKASKTQRVKEFLKKKKEKIKSRFQKIKDNETLQTIVSTLKNFKSTVYSLFSDSSDIVSAKFDYDKALKIKDAGLTDASFEKLSDEAQQKILGEALSNKLDNVEKIGWVKGIVSGLGIFKTIGKACKGVGEYYKEKKERGDGGIFSVGGLERWQQTRKGFDFCAKLLEGVAGVFDGLDVGIPILSPILSIISSTFGIVNDTIHIIDSSVRKHELKKQKQDLWNQMAEKRDKYNKKKDYISSSAYNLYNMRSYDEKLLMEAVRLKRDELREQVNIDGRTKNNLVSKTKNDYQYFNPNKELKKGEINKPEKVKNTRADYGNYFYDLSEQIVLEKEKENKDKQKIHMMEALNMLNKLNSLNEAEDKQRKQLASQGEDLAKDGVQFIAGVVKFIGDVGAGFSAGATFAVSAVGSTISMACTLGEKVHQGVSAIHSHREKKDGRAKDKQLRRSDIAETLTESVNQLITNKKYGWNGTSFDLDIVDDNRMSVAASDLKNFNQILIGTDIDFHELAMSENKEDFVLTLSEAFSQGDD